MKYKYNGKILHNAKIQWEGSYMEATYTQCLLLA